MHLHLVQFSPEWENRAANYARVHTLIAQAQPAPGSLIILPETFSTGFSLNTAVTAEPENGPTEQFLRSLAQQKQSCVLGGLITRSADDRGMNQSIAIAPGGEVLARYTKNRPFTLGGEDKAHVAGRSVGVYTWQGVQIAPLICYDLRFPELARAAVREGAEVLIYIAAWPIKRVQHWITLLQARAIENQAFVIGVNRCGTDPDFTYPGRSILVDPHGVILADAADREHVLSTTLDIEIAREWRRDFPALRDAGLT